MFPGPPTDTNPGANTPNEPDKTTRTWPARRACNVFDEQHRLFGFAPGASRTSAFYDDSRNPARSGGYRPRRPERALPRAASHTLEAEARPQARYVARPPV